MAVGTRRVYVSFNVVLFSTGNSTVMCVNVNHVQAFFSKKVFDSLAAPCCLLHVCTYTQPGKGDFFSAKLSKHTGYSAARCPPRSGWRILRKK